MYIYIHIYIYICIERERLTYIYIYIYTNDYTNDNTGLLAVRLGLPPGGALARVPRRAGPADWVIAIIVIVMIITIIVIISMLYKHYYLCVLS